MLDIHDLKSLEESADKAYKILFKDLSTAQARVLRQKDCLCAPKNYMEVRVIKRKFQELRDLMQNIEKNMDAKDSGGRTK
jgi:hypothetical protein